MCVCVKKQGRHHQGCVNMHVCAVKYYRVTCADVCDVVLHAETFVCVEISVS